MTSISTIDVSVRIHEGEEAAHVSTPTELDRVIESAGGRSEQGEAPWRDRYAALMIW
jgi:hypothetical protein